MHLFSLFIHSFSPGLSRDMASETSSSYLLLKSSCLQDDAVRRLRRNAPATFGSSQALLSSRARLWRHHTPSSLIERSGAVYNSSTALLGDGPSYPFHAGAASYRLRLGAYHGFTTKHGDRSGKIQETPHAESSTLRLRSVGHLSPLPLTLSVVNILISGSQSAKAHKCS